MNLFSVNTKARSQCGYDMFVGRTSQRFFVALYMFGIIKMFIPYLWDLVRTIKSERYGLLLPIPSSFGYWCQYICYILRHPNWYFIISFEKINTFSKLSSHQTTFLKVLKIHLITIYSSLDCASTSATLLFTFVLVNNSIFDGFDNDQTLTYVFDRSRKGFTPWCVGSAKCRHSDMYGCGSLHVCASSREISSTIQQKSKLCSVYCSTSRFAKVSISTESSFTGPVFGRLFIHLSFPMYALYIPFSREDAICVLN